MPLTAEPAPPARASSPAPEPEAPEPRQARKASPAPRQGPSRTPRKAPGASPKALEARAAAKAPRGRQGAPERPETGRWGLFRRLQVPGRGRLDVLRLVIEDVPAATKAAEVLQVLEGAGLAAAYSEEGVPFANHRALPEARWPEHYDTSASLRAESWGSLRGTRGPSTRRLGLVVPAPLWSRLTLAAARSGQSMQAYVTELLAEGLSRLEGTAQ